jgi:hypothetical protein
MRRRDDNEGSSLLSGPTGRPSETKPMVGISSSNYNASGGIGKMDTKTSAPKTEKKKQSYGNQNSTESSSYQSSGYQSSYQSGGAFDSTPSHSRQNNDYTSSPSTRIGSMNGIGSNGHLGSIKKNYYQEAREKQAQAEHNPWLVSIITDMLKYIYESITHVGANTIGGVVRGRSSSSAAKGDFPAPELVLDYDTRQRLEEFKTFGLTPYDSENHEHEKLLGKLWVACMDDAPLKSRISEQWKELGFQGTNPATDFRGSGVLGLTNLLYFANTYRSIFRKQFTRTAQTANSYPFVIAGLNITMLLFNILGWGMNSHKVHNLTARKNFIQLLVNNENSNFGTVAETGTPTSTKKVSSRRKSTQDDWGWDDNADSEGSPDKSTKEGTLLDFGESSPVPLSPKKTKAKKKKPKKKEEKNIVFEEMYVAAFRILDEEWYLIGAKYFNFPQVLDATRARVEDMLESKIGSLVDIKHFNSTGKYK